jgi:hypothetical protein
MGMYRGLAFGVLSAVLALSACAAVDGQPGAATPAPSVSAAAPEASGSPGAPSPSGGPAASGSPGAVPSVEGNNPSEGGKAGADITIQGTVTAGVEAGCYILRSDDGRFSYLLLGGDRNTIMEGGRMEVTGRPAPNMMYCQQGTPFTVTSVRRI